MKEKRKNIFELIPLVLFGLGLIGAMFWYGAIFIMDLFSTISNNIRITLYVIAIIITTAIIIQYQTFIKSRIAYYSVPLRLIILILLIISELVSVHSDFIYIVDILCVILFVLIILFAGLSETLMIATYILVVFYTYLYVQLVLSTDFSMITLQKIFIITIQKLFIITILFSFISSTFISDTIKLFKLLITLKIKKKNIISYFLLSWKFPASKETLIQIVKSNNEEFLHQSKCQCNMITDDNFRYQYYKNTKFLIVTKLNWHKSYRSGILSIKGWWLFKPKYFISDRLKNNGFYLYSKSNSGSGKFTYFYIGSNGKRLNKYNFDTVTDFKYGNAIVSVNGDYGLMNKEGIMILECNYRKVTIENEYFISTGDSHKYAYTNNGSRLSTQFYFSFHTKKNSKIASFCRQVGNNPLNKAWGYINSEGVVEVEIIPCRGVDNKESNEEQFTKYKAKNKYGEMTECKYDILNILENEKTGRKHVFGTYNGQLVLLSKRFKEIKLKGFSISSISEYFIIVKEKRKSEDEYYDNFLYGVTDIKGKLILEITYDSISIIGSEQPDDVIFIASKENSKEYLDYGLFDSKGNSILELIYDEIKIFNKNHLALNKNLLSGISKNNGEIIFDVKYYEIHEFESNNNFLILVMDEKYGLGNLQGKIIFDVIYDKIEECKENMDFVILIINDRKGLGNLNGNIIYETIYDNLFICEEIKNCVILGRKGLFGLGNINGDIIIDIEYDELFCDSDNFIHVEKNGLNGIMNNQGHIILPLEFNFWMPRLENGIRVVSKDEMYGFFNPYASAMPSLIYDYINVYENGFSKLNKANKYGLRSPDGDIIPIEYDTIDYSEMDELWVFTKGSEYYIFNGEDDPFMINKDEALTYISNNDEK